MSESVEALRARAEANWKRHAIAVGLVGWCLDHGVRPDSFHYRADEAKRNALRAERQLARIER